MKDFLKKFYRLGKRHFYYFCKKLNIPTHQPTKPVEFTSAEFEAEFAQLEQMMHESGRDKSLAINWDDRHPFLQHRNGQICIGDHYTYHLAWAARWIKEITPQYHVDISSNFKFITTISAFIPTRYYEFHPPKIDLSGLSCHCADITKLPLENASTYSLSCMHVIEHIGLGRYGDILDSDGDLKAINELKRVLAPGGHLLFVVPVGRPRIVFNAHRVYGADQIIRYFAGLELYDFALETDVGEFIMDANPELANQQEYGCGSFYFRKPED